MPTYHDREPQHAHIDASGNRAPLKFWFAHSRYVSKGTVGYWQRCRSSYQFNSYQACVLWLFFSHALTFVRYLQLKGLSFPCLVRSSRYGYFLFQIQLVTASMAALLKAERLLDSG
jgi:hypothetical protein